MLDLEDTKNAIEKVERLRTSRIRLFVGEGKRLSREDGINGCSELFRLQDDLQMYGSCPVGVMYLSFLNVPSQLMYLILSSGFIASPVPK